MKSDLDTIAAITTATGNAGISIVRVSGTDAISIADSIFRGSKKKPSELGVNSFAHGYIKERKASADIDEVLLLVFRAPHSYTCEDVVEIQGHGGRECARRILRAVIAGGARMAGPGEFTRRAFLNGRIDLLQAEAVIDLIQASSDRAASAAVEQLSGFLSSLFTGTYDILIDALSDLEATLDFSDQELPDNILSDIEGRISKAEASLQSALDTWEEGHILREGASIVITGDSNVGKSTLLNRLLNYNRAIVTDIPGTTRDVIEEQIIISGMAFRIFDTAGIRDSDCHIEREGISRAQELLKKADITLYVIDSTKADFKSDINKLALLKEKDPIVILNKQDINPGTPDCFAEYNPLQCILLDESGAEDIRAALDQRADAICTGTPHAVISERHRQIIQYVLNAIAEANKQLVDKGEASVVLAASQLKNALEQLGTIDGRVYSEELLDNIFNRFCIGK